MTQPLKDFKKCVLVSVSGGRDFSWPPLEDVNEKELYLNHDAYKGLSYLPTTLIFITSIIVLSYPMYGSSMLNWTYANPWFCGTIIGSFILVIAAEFLKYNIPNHYFLDKVQVFDQRAIGKRLLRRRLMRLPMLLIILYGMYTYVPWVALESYNGPLRF